MQKYVLYLTFFVLTISQCVGYYSTQQGHNGHTGRRNEQSQILELFSSFFSAVAFGCCCWCIYRGMRQRARAERYGRMNGYGQQVPMANQQQLPMANYY